MTSGRLSGLRAIVTGSSRGIGRTIALEFAKQGADVIVNCNLAEDEALLVVKEIKGKDRKSSFCLADVSSYKDAERLVAHAVKELGGVDILVNNAGITKDDLLVNLNIEDWTRIIATNLTGVLNCTKAVLPVMKKQHSGRIINIASVVGEMGNIGQSSYAASKAGVIGLTKTFARELARDGILVNAIAPGFCRTTMVERIPDEVKEKILKTVPMRRFGEAEEVAKVAVFLASPDSSYITGQIIGVNGGMYM
jgi:3-oxoacyl-[acyl-carrier protein] reductase